MREYKGYIYCITNKVNSKVYIGQTKASVKERFAEHLRCARNLNGGSCLLYRAMRKHGVENFSVEIIECVCADSKENLRERLNEREIFYIKNRSSYKPSGYNMTPGGDNPPLADLISVIKVSDCGVVLAVYDSIAEAARMNGINKNTIQHALNSVSHFSSDFYWYMKDDFDNVDIGHIIGRQTRTDITSVYCFSLAGEFIKLYESVSNAERETGVNHSKICAVCSGCRKSAGGYLWSYTSTPPSYRPQDYTNRCKPVMQMTLDGTPMNEFASATDAARKLELQSSLITACCKGRRKSTGGYRWTFSM